MAIVNIESKSDRPLLFEDISQNYLMNYILSARQFIEFIPAGKYISKSTLNISLPKILDNKPFLFTAHLAVGHLGAMPLPAESVSNGLVVSAASSAAFGMRLAASHYLNEQRQDIASKDMDGFEIAKYCAATMLAYTVPSIATCAIANTIMPGVGCSITDLGTKISLVGAECYSIYKASTQAVETPTTADIVVPYIADTIAIVVSCANGGSVLSVVSSIVTADYLTRIVTDMMPTEVKASYIDPAFNFIHDVSYNIYQEASDLITCIANENNIMGCFAAINSTQEL